MSQYHCYLCDEGFPAETDGVYDVDVGEWFCNGCYPKIVKE